MGKKSVQKKFDLIVARDNLHLKRNKKKQKEMVKTMKEIETTPKCNICKFVKKDFWDFFIAF